MPNFAGMPAMTGGYDARGGAGGGGGGGGGIADGGAR